MNKNEGLRAVGMMLTPQTPALPGSLQLTVQWISCYSFFMSLGVACSNVKLFIAVGEDC